MNQSDSFSYLSFVSPEYLENLRSTYFQNPESLPLTWRLFFDGVEVGEQLAHEYLEGLGTTNGNGKGGNGHFSETGVAAGIDTELRILNLIEAYRQRGHLAAHLNPLSEFPPIFPKHLELGKFGLERISSSEKYQAAKIIGLPPSTLPDIVQRLREIYCRDIGVEYKHISDDGLVSWLENKMEPTGNRTLFKVEENKVVLEDLIHATLFESFLQKSFTGQKRFSLEGGESIIPAMKRIVRIAAAEGAKEVIFGMAHRGRLNVLANVLKKSPEEIFSEFEGAPFATDFGGSGDVKYHLGYSNNADVNGSQIHFSLCFNPSHLEAIGPVLLGVARAKLDHLYPKSEQVLPILIHGDAAVIAQGVVTESLNMANLEGYATGGTIHLVINNQIGFTTSPEDARSTAYCTDFAKAVQAPVFHVNGDSVESVMHVVSIAAEFRSKFKRDVFVDIYCYRKYGHNEGDEPRFTQPVMYAQIGKQKSTLDKFSEILVRRNEFSREYIEERKKAYNDELEQKLESVKQDKKPQNINTMKSRWSKYRVAKPGEMCEFLDTSIKATDFEKIIETIHEIPKDIEPLPKFKKMLEGRLEKFKQDGLLDWAMAEQLAMGSLLLEGYTVRFTGQDVRRGTFSHRHAEITDSRNSKKIIPLKKLESNGSHLAIYNSPLSEYAVMGFEYGYSLAEPNALTIWEAQFGDFGNGAQIIIDQFISSSESKWRRMSGLVLLLPHGYEGQGPEHSSARLERFLQLAGDDNFYVCYPTTSSQMFHLLRRQVIRPFRKPLIVMTPKSPLRMPEVMTPKSDFLKGGFKTILKDESHPSNTTRVFFCSGKVFWDLQKRMHEKGLQGKVTIVRLEQLYPLDQKGFLELKDKYKNVKEWVWVQEEPKNMGAWSYFKLATDDLGFNFKYVGRKSSASVATGSSNSHKKELEQLLEEAFRSL
ncbi:MAG: 2-oxoglutarate dehydrogenase E1 component [Pseudomonadota bacterium]|nr:2-oxoglutarate dehydrogenase E1 component [Pseudomonadota bacterium]